MPALPEQELLKACVRNTLEPSFEKQVSARLGGEISWERFLLLADINDVLPLVYTSCSRFEQKIPRQVLARMARRSAAIAAWNLINRRRADCRPGGASEQWNSCRSI